MATPLPKIHARFSLGEIAYATGGAPTGDASMTVEGVSLDTRTLTSGALFVALAGERFDAHAHLAEAVARGARALLVKRGTAVRESVAVVHVADTLRALGSLARHHAWRLREGRKVPVVAIGGAVGKTTTKELTRAAMQAAFGGPCHATVGNLNNLVGAPVTLLGLDESHVSAVIECGTNAPGEIARLGAVIEPDVALVMNADATHTEGLGSIEGVAKEEGSLFGFARRAVVGNADEPLSRAEMSRAKSSCARWLFGVSADAQMRVIGRRVLPDGSARIAFLVADALCPHLHDLWVETALIGPAVATNFAAALAATAAAGADAEGMRRAALAVGEVAAVSGRLNVIPVGTSVVIDDTYNASPRAVRAALEAAVEVATERGGRLVVALGDMLELGALSASEHAAIGRAVTDAGAGLFVAVGAEMARAAEVSGVKALRATDSEEASEVLSGAVRAGDVVLVKGSRGMRMERCVEALRRVLA